LMINKLFCRRVYLSSTSFKYVK